MALPHFDSLRDFGRSDVRNQPWNEAWRHELMNSLPGRVDAGIVERHRTTPPTLRFQIGTLLSLLVLAALVCL